MDAPPPRTCWRLLFFRMAALTRAYLIALSHTLKTGSLALSNSLDRAHALAMVTIPHQKLAGME